VFILSDNAGEHTMDPKTIEDLAKKLSSAIPAGVKDLQHDIEKNFRAVLESTFAKLNLVTREEFEVQKGVLARTRAKVEALEAQINALETALAVKAADRTTAKKKH
jgi:BMFP domain-containing protein YqiC